jgi:hypothetical protein
MEITHLHFSEYSFSLGSSQFMFEIRRHKQRWKNVESRIYQMGN